MIALITTKLKKKMPEKTKTLKTGIAFIRFLIYTIYIFITLSRPRIYVA